MADPQPDQKGAASHDHGLSPLAYVLVFTSFGLFTLVLFSNKYERRQMQIEQKYHGIQNMQRGTTGAGQGGAVQSPDQPLLIRLRPLMIALFGISLVAWIFLLFRSLRRGKRPAPKSGAAP